DRTERTHPAESRSSSSARSDQHSSEPSRPCPPARRNANKRAADGFRSPSAVRPRRRRNAPERAASHRLTCRHRLEDAQSHSRSFHAFQEPEIFFTTAERGHLPEEPAPLEARWPRRGE